MEPRKLTCEVCGKNEAAGVCSMPGVPCSVAYCSTCLEMNAHPWYLLVANTAILGGLNYAAPWWREMVENTCTRLGKTLAEFNADVQASSAKEDREMDDQP